MLPQEIIPMFLMGSGPFFIWPLVSKNLSGSFQIKLGLISFFSAMLLTLIPPLFGFRDILFVLGILGIPIIFCGVIKSCNNKNSSTGFFVLLTIPICIEVLHLNHLPSYWLTDHLNKATFHMLGLETVSNVLVQIITYVTTIITLNAGFILGISVRTQWIGFFPATTNNSSSFFEI